MLGFDLSGAEPLAAGLLGLITFAFLRIFSQTIPYSQRDHLVLVPEAVEQMIGARSFEQALHPYSLDQHVQLRAQ